VAIRLTDELKARFTASAARIHHHARGHPCSRRHRQTVLQRVKRGEIQAAHVTKGGKVGLRLKLPDRQPTLFEPA